MLNKLCRVEKTSTAKYFSYTYKLCFVKDVSCKYFIQIKKLEVLKESFFFVVTNKIKN